MYVGRLLLDPPFLTTAQSSAVSARRKSVGKRPLVCSDDEDGPAKARFGSQRTKRARTIDDDDHHRDDEEVEVDDGDDKRFLPDEHDARSKARPSTKVAAVSSKRRVVYSDEEDVDVDMDADDDDDEDEDDAAARLSADTDDDSALKRGAQTKATKGSVANGKAGQKITKGKAGKEETDERKTLSMSRASSIAASTHPSDMATNEDAAPTTAKPTEPTGDPADPLFPKKRKLPPIKKNKPPAATTSTSSGGVVGSKPPLPTIQQRKSALSGGQEVDLRDHKIYAELFKAVSIPAMTTWF